MSGDFSIVRPLARLLQLEAEVAAGRNQWGASAKSGLGAIELGSEMQQHSAIEGLLAGNMCEAFGRSPIWKAVDHLSADEARAAQKRLMDIEDHRVTLADAMIEQKWATLDGLREIMREPGWRWREAGGEERSWRMYLALLPYSRARILKTAERIADNQISKAQEPYSLYGPYAQWDEAPADPVNQRYVWNTYGYRFEDTLNQTENLLLITTLALRAYRVDHGQYPVNLEALRPEYLRKIPIDPFATGASLQYKLTKTGYVLYSVGPDAIDNRGTAMGNPAAGANPDANAIKQNGSGDIVAGVNRGLE
jgi:hypothetical protein